MAVKTYHRTDLTKVLGPIHPENHREQGRHLRSESVLGSRYGKTMPHLDGQSII